MLGKQRFIWISLVAGFLVVLPVTAGSNSKSSGTPQLLVESPKPGQTFDDTPIVIKLKVKNFKLLPPVPYFGKAGPQNVGHIHVTLDDYPLIATAETQIMIGKMAGEEYLPEGKHTLWVELSVDNHDSLTPPVRQKVTFYTMHPRNKAGKQLGFGCRHRQSG